MTAFILNHNELPIEKRMKTISEKLEEMEWHQKHELIALRRARLQEIERKTGKKSKSKENQGKKKARENNKERQIKKKSQKKSIKKRKKAGKRKK